MMHAKRTSLPSAPAACSCAQKAMITWAGEVNFELSGDEPEAVRWRRSRLLTTSTAFRLAQRSKFPCTQLRSVLSLAPS